MKKSFTGRQTAKVAITNGKGKILILETIKGEWDFAGGNMNAKDNKRINRTAKREIDEETGLETTTPVAIGKLFYEDKLRHLYVARAKKGEVQFDRDEHQAYKWVKPSELKDYNLKPKLKYLLKTQRKTVRKGKKVDPSVAVIGQLKLAA